MCIKTIINAPIAAFRARPSEYGSCPIGVRTYVFGSKLNLLQMIAHPNAEKDKTPIIHIVPVIMLAVLSSILYMLSFLLLITINNSILDKFFQYRLTFLGDGTVLLAAKGTSR